MNQLKLAGCVIRDARGKILLLHRNTAKRVQWEIPGGKIDPGEDARTTAVREVREETGAEVDIVRHLGEKSFEEDLYTMVYTWYLATVVEGTPSVREPETHDRCEFFSPAELAGMEHELSPNTRNFLAELNSGKISM
jgi:8-oxo-dGTP diphosphatase